MPITPLHFGPGAVVALIFRRAIDLPVFILANVVVDIEPLMVMIFQYNYPLHGYAHTFLFGGTLGILWALAAFGMRDFLKKAMNVFALPYKARLGRMLLSGVLGIWFHVLLDSPLYADIRPFYPSDANPLYGLLGDAAVYKFCMLCFIPAIGLYLAGVLRTRER